MRCGEVVCEVVGWCGEVVGEVVGRWYVRWWGAVGVVW